MLVAQRYAYLLSRSSVESVEFPGTVIAGCLFKCRLRIRRLRPPSAARFPVLKIRHFFANEQGSCGEGDCLPLPHPRPAGPGLIDLGTIADAPKQPGEYELNIGPAVDAPFVSVSLPSKRPVHVVPHSDALMASLTPVLDVTMDVTSRCSLRCIQCRKTHEETHADQHDIAPELFQKIAREVFPCARTLMLSSAGEPLMAKSFWQALETAMEYDIQEVGFCSNGVLLSRRRAEQVVDMGVGRAEFSVDGASREVYERIRVGADFGNVVGNIGYLSACKKKRRSRLPLIRLNVVLMRSNIHELPDIIDLAADLGAEEVLCQHMIVFTDRLRSESLLLDKHLSNDNLKAAAERAARRQLRFYHPPLFDLPGEDANPAPPSPSPPPPPAPVSSSVLPAVPSRADVIYADEGGYSFQRRTHQATVSREPRCMDPWRKVSFDWRGQVFPCCAWEGEPIGDIDKASFHDIWNSPEYRRLRKGLTEGPMPDPCRNCSVISGRNVNDESGFFFRAQP